jgi:flavin reductase (DIM6/NTAB) family NADH-FMN oxidoreductase RutF
LHGAPFESTHNRIVQEQVMEEEALQADFKQAMRRLAATIAIVTSGNGDERTGMAATAVTSITSDPPTLLVAVNRNASLSPVMKRDRRFCVNLLAERHADIVGIFSGQRKGLARFEVGDWTTSDEGLPILSDAVASLVCTTSTTVEVATHTLFIGEVTRVYCHSTIDPLIWVDGRLARTGELCL